MKKLSSSEYNARLRARITKRTIYEDGHHIWQGQLFDGAPVVKVRNRYLGVRRILYGFIHKVKYDDIPVVRRTCSVERCINPLHFELTNRKVVKPGEKRLSE